MNKCNVFKHKTYDGVLKVAISKVDGTKFYDTENRGGFLTSYIRDVLGVEIPSLYFRKKYYKETNKQWWEQWFDIVEEDRPLSKKCPYCNWETFDIENRTGAMVNHISKVHSLKIEDVIKEFPEYSEYFSKATKENKKKEDFKNSKNYIICPICGEKFYKLTSTHLKTVHGLTIEEFKELYPDFKTYSDLMIEQVVGIQKYSNLSVSKKRFVSKYEREIQDFLRKNNVEFETNRQMLIGKELDIYIPSKRIAIEFNGLRWHTEWSGKKDKYYHLNKTEMCNSKGVGLIHIFEDEYVLRKELVYSKLKHLLKVENEAVKKIHARKCSVTEISYTMAKEFLNKNHIQGFVSSSYYIGAYYEDELIGVMSFKKETNSSNEWELSRFATKIGTLCNGVGGKLFHFFVKQKNPFKVKSFADRRWTININDNLYTKIGFKLDKILKPDYYYYNGKIDKYGRLHKFLFRKQILHKKYGLPLSMTETEMVKELGYDRIWNCGLIKYVWANNNGNDIDVDPDI